MRDEVEIRKVLQELEANIFKGNAKTTSIRIGALLWVLGESEAMEIVGFSKGRGLTKGQIGVLRYLANNRNSTIHVAQLLKFHRLTNLMLMLSRLHISHFVDITDAVTLEMQEVKVTAKGLQILEDMESMNLPTPEEFKQYDQEDKRLRQSA